MKLIIAKCNFIIQNHAQQSPWSMPHCVAMAGGRPVFMVAQSTVVVVEMVVVGKVAKNLSMASISESNRFWKKINDQNETRGKEDMFIDSCNSQWTCWFLQFLNRYDPESKEISTLELQLQWKHWHVSLCSTKFLNMMLRMTLLKFDNFTATPILSEITFWRIQITVGNHATFGLTYLESTLKI